MEFWVGIAELSFLLAMVLTIVTFVGHGLWLVCRALLGWSTGSSPSSVHGFLPCPRCRTMKDRSRNDCDVCDWPHPVETASSQRRALSLQRKQLDDWLRAGVLSAEAHQALLAANESVVAGVIPTMSPVAIDAVPVLDSHRAEASPALTRIGRPWNPITSPGTSPVGLTESVKASTVVAALVEGRPEIDAPGESMPPRRTMSEWFSSFLEEKNIRWGEVSGGLLIVGCTIALLIRFWGEIGQRPFLKYGLFNGITAAIFGVARYTEQRWKLPNTSRGLYVVGALLISLNVAAMSSLRPSIDAVSLTTFVGEGVAVIVFAWLLWMSRRAVWPHFGLTLPAAMMLCAVGQLCVRHLLVPHRAWPIEVVIGVLPVLAIGCITWSVWRERSNWQPFTEAYGNEVFRVLGVTIFASLSCSGLLLLRAASRTATLEILSPLLACFAAGPLAIGLVLRDAAARARLAKFAVAMTSLAVAGAITMMSASVAAWPQPSTLAIVFLVDALVLIAVARCAPLALAWFPASLCATMVYLLGAWVALGRVPWRVIQADQLLSVGASALTAKLLVVPAVVWVTLASRWYRRGWQEPSRWIGVTSGLAAGWSLLCGMVWGWGRANDHAQIAWVFLFHGAMSALAATRLWPRALTILSGCVTFLGIAQALVYGRWGNFSQPWTYSVLSLAMLLAVVARGSATAWCASRCIETKTWRDMAEIVTAVATCFVLLGFSTQNGVQVGWQCIGLSVVWWVLWTIRRADRLAKFVSVMATIGFLGIATGSVQSTEWYLATKRPWLDPWLWQIWGFVLIACATISISLRCALPLGIEAIDTSNKRWLALRRLLPIDEPGSVERVSLLGAVGLLIASALYGALPGAAQELTPRSFAQQLLNVAPEATERLVPPLDSFEFLQSPHAHGWTWGAWMLWFVAVAVVIFRWSRSLRRADSLLVTGLFSIPCWLVAGWMEHQGATASTLRWTLTGYFLATSIIMAARGAFVSRLVATSWADQALSFRGQSRGVWWTSCGSMVVPWLAMGLYVVTTAWWHRSPDHALGSALVVSGICLAVTQAIQLASISTAQTSLERASGRGLRRGVAFVGSLPFLVVGLVAMSVALRGNPIAGPHPGSWFDRAGLAISYAGPLVLITLALIVHAIGERASVYGLVAGWLLNASVTAGYLLAPRAVPFVLDAEGIVRVVELNAAVSGVYALLWWMASVWQRRVTRSLDDPLPECLVVQSLLGMVLYAAVLVPAGTALFWTAQSHAVHAALGSVSGWIAWFLVGVPAGIVVARATTFPVPATMGDHEVNRWNEAWRWLSIVFVLQWSLIVLIGVTIGQRQSDAWAALHTTLVGHAIGAVSSLGLSWWALRREWLTGDRVQHVVPWVAGSIGLTLCLAVRGVWEFAFRGPMTFEIVGFLAASGASAALGCLSARQPSSSRSAFYWQYLAALCWQVAATVWMMRPSARWSPTESIWLQALALSLPSLLWLLIDLRWLRPARRGANVYGVHRMVVVLAAVLLACRAVAGVINGPHLDLWSARDSLGWLALATTCVGAMGCLWDPQARGAVASLYAMGLLVVAFTLDRLHVSPGTLLLNIDLLLAAYTMLTSYLWSRRAGLASRARAWGIPVDDALRWESHHWLSIVNGLAAVWIGALSAYLVLKYESLVERLAVANASLSQVVSLYFVSRGPFGDRLRPATLLVGAWGAVLWGWARLEPSGSWQVLDRTVISSAALIATTLGYGLGLTKWLPPHSSWLGAVRQVTVICLSGALVLLMIVLGAELLSVMLDKALIWSFTSKMIVGVSWTFIGMAAIGAAGLPGRDPLQLTERGQQAYVYGAEVSLAALLLHLRLSLPWLFGAAFAAYWPLLTLAIAFTGVGLSDWFRRRQRRAFSEPLERTGVFLPLLPVVGAWIHPSQVDYSLVLLPVGLLYAWIAIRRRSFAWSVVSALAMNGGLWHYLSRQPGWGIFDHPQMWLIPPALCVLIASYLQRSELSRRQLTQLRYLSALTIYVSSTSDIVLQGMRNAPWLAGVLAGLSLLGMASGMLLRIRSLLFLGMTFLSLSVLCVIWYAAHDLQQTWVWAASGLVLGIGLIVVFAVLERKRESAAHLLKQLRAWDE